MGSHLLPGADSADVSGDFSGQEPEHRGVGVLLDFAVSGHGQTSILQPTFATGHAWLTGGGFGLEGSLQGLVPVIVLMLALSKLKEMMIT